MLDINLNISPKNLSKNTAYNSSGNLSNDTAYNNSVNQNKIHSSAN